MGNNCQGYAGARNEDFSDLFGKHPVVFGLLREEEGGRQNSTTDNGQHARENFK